MAGLAAFEYQTAGNNNPNRMMSKRETTENRYGQSEAFSRFYNL
jgi:hypothetical protein